MPKRSRTRSRGQQGGNAYPPSAWGNVLETAGNGWTQFMNTFSLNNSINNSINNSSQSLNSNGLVLKDTSRSGINVKPMAGGRRRKTRSRRGGNIGPVLNQAAVPLALLAMNQYAKRRSFKNRSSKKRSFRRRR
jgi:hypothetical protein